MYELNGESLNEVVVAATALFTSIYDQNYVLENIVRTTSCYRLPTRRPYPPTLHTALVT